MSSIRIEPRSSEKAREQAERHRKEIAHTLEMLGEKLNQAVDKAEDTRERFRQRIDDAEDRLRQPVMWLRDNPGRTLALGMATGLLYALLTGSRRHSRSRSNLDAAINALRLAYLEGRRDERRMLARERTLWNRLLGTFSRRPPAPAALPRAR